MTNLDRLWKHHTVPEARPRVRQRGVPQIYLGVYRIVRKWDQLDVCALYISGSELDDQARRVVGPGGPSLRKR